MDNPNLTVAKFQLRLRSSVKQDAQAVSQSRGLSLNQFINQAVAEKLAHLEQEEWVKNRLEPSDVLAERAIALLEKARGNPVVVGDELPSDLISNGSVHVSP